MHLREIWVALPEVRLQQPQEQLHPVLPVCVCVQCIPTAMGSNIYTFFPRQPRKRPLTFSLLSNCRGSLNIRDQRLMGATYFSLRPRD